MNAQTMPKSALRHRPVNPTQATNVVTPRTSAHPSRVLGHYRPQQRRRVPLLLRILARLHPRLSDDEALIDELTSQQPAPNTDADSQIAPSTRTGYLQYQPPRDSRWHHPLVWIGLTLLLVLILYWATTEGLAWWNNTLVNPGKYGPMQGSIVTGVFGGGDSQAQPSKLIAMNNNGRVAIIMLHANDPSKSQFLIGPDLIALNFPDPTHAHVDLLIGDFDHDGNQDVQVTIVSTTYDKPLFPYAQQYTLYGDGQGNLKQRQQ